MRRMPPAASPPVLQTWKHSLTSTLFYPYPPPPTMKPQAPKGTRDFYPKQMAWRNYLTDAWRRVSIRNGFEQVDGPIFESLLTL